MGKVKMGKKRKDNAGPRKYLDEEEVQALVRAAGKVGRHGHRDATMIMVGFRHGLRVSELCGLRWDQVNFERKVMHVGRLKGGQPSTHDMSGPEMRELRRVLRESPDPKSKYVFLSERGTTMDRRNFNYIIERAGRLAGTQLRAHSHMLRHACGYALANRGVDTRAIQAWLGHTNISMTVRYTALAEDRLRGIWGGD